MSAWRYAAVLLLAAAALVLEDATDGRSWGVLAIAGLIAIADGVASLRRKGVATPRRPRQVDAPLRALAGIVAGAALVVVGVLAASGAISVGG